MKTERNMNVLICDDKETDTANLVCILGYSYGSAVKTTVFKKASDTLEYIRSGAEVDVCFLETITPEMNGIKLAGELRGEGYEGEIVFLTSAKVYGPDAFKVNATDYLLKPVMPERVRSALSNAERKLNKQRGTH